MKKTFMALAAIVLCVMASANDLTLRYDRPAQFFEEALVIGNGNIGATVYGGINRERISLNDITLWTGEPETGVTTPGASSRIPEIRRAIDRGDFRAADSLNMFVQGHYSENYQPLGTLNITFNGIDSAAVTGYNRSLSLNDAVARSTFTIGNLRRTTSAFVSASDSVIVLRIGGEIPVNATISLTSLLPHQTSASGSDIVQKGYAAYHSLPGYADNDPRHMLYDPKRGTRFCTILKAIPEEGTVTPNPDGSLTLTGCRNVMLLITNVTSFNGFNRDPATQGRDYATLAASRIDRASQKPYQKLLDAHKRDYASLFSRVNIDLGTTADSIASLPTDVQLKRYTDLRESNPDLEELYFQYGRYLLISSSRTPGVPANLQGVWNEHLLPPWSSNYTTNINVEENYWPAEVAALGELHETAMIGWINNLTESGTRTARNYYGVGRGWCLGHNSDIWAMTNPIGLQTNSPSWACWNMGGAWVSTHIWEHYLFSRDLGFLRRNYPALKGAAEFCLGWLIEKDGNLLTSPSTSPENIYITPGRYKGATLAGAAADLAMIHQCLADTRDAAATLGIDTALQSEISATLPRLQPYKIGHKGNLQEWLDDWDDEDPQHRHQSHLFGLYPGRHITPDGTPELAAACARTLDIKGDNTTGWSTGWRVNLRARLLDADNAYAMYRRLLRYVSPDKYRGPDRRKGGGTYPNLLDAHSPFQIDGNFGGTAGVAEMLIQSTPDSITLLPALPTEWHTGSATGLRTRCGITVDLQWADGRVTSATLTSPIPATATLHFNNTSQAVTISPSSSLILR